MPRNDRHRSQQEQNERWREGLTRRKADAPNPVGYYVVAVAIVFLAAVLLLPIAARWRQVSAVATPPLLSNVPAPVTHENVTAQPNVAQQTPTPSHVQTAPSAPQAAPQGMVSAAYLAKFRAEREQRRTTQHTVSRTRDQQWISSFDGHQRYLAQWLAVDNSIDGTSVCENQGRGSIDYRECRKGAKVFFREQCRAWAARAQQDREPWSFQMKARYCEAESGFNPLG